MLCPFMYGFCIKKHTMRLVGLSVSLCSTALFHLSYICIYRAGIKPIWPIWSNRAPRLQVNKWTEITHGREWENPVFSLLMGADTASATVTRPCERSPSLVIVLTLSVSLSGSLFIIIYLFILVISQICMYFG